MKTLGLILTLTLLTFTGYAQETTCDLSDGTAIVTLNENSTPNEIITEFPNAQGGTIVFTEEVSAVLPTQVLIVEPNGQSVFIDALVYTTAFGTMLTLYEFNNTIQGTIRGLSSGSTQDLANCSVN